METPGYSKPAHGYGQPYGISPDTADEDWAGSGYVGEPLAPEVLGPVECPA